jgi:molecular chaperone GrpE
MTDPSHDQTGAGSPDQVPDDISSLDDLAPADAAAVAEAEAIFEHDVETLLAERDQFKDIALRLQADFENYRKRVATQQADEVDRATGKIAEALLPVLDACEAAFGHGVTGIESVWSSLIGVLQKQGLEALDLAGQPFDPAVAEAVIHEPGDGEPVVAEVLRTGYRWKGRVLRAAMVKVRG